MITKDYLLFSKTSIHDATVKVIHPLPFNYVIKDEFSFFDGRLICERWVEISYSMFQMKNVMTHSLIRGAHEIWGQCLGTFI